MPTLHIAYAGGGTGGHIYPAIAVHEQLSKLCDTTPLFVCSARPIDAEILRASGLPFVATPAKPFGVRPRELLSFLGSWGGAVRAVRAELRRMKSLGGRGCGVGMLTTGGFVAAPAVQAARAERVPVVMLNLDAVPGRANRWIARHACEVRTAARVASGLGREWEVVPPVVRKSALPPGDAQTCRRILGLDPARPVVLVTGASQGARSINQFMIQMVRAHPGAFAGWQVLHQTGPTDAEEAAQTYAGAGIPAIVEPFVHGLGVWWGASELAVGRCGAGVVAEAWASQTPAFFMPYPYHRDQHQRANASALASAGAALIVDDRVDSGPNVIANGSALLALLADAPRRGSMRAAYGGLGPVDGARQVAQVLAGLVPARD